jgi:hypothetical protein
MNFIDTNVWCGSWPFAPLGQTGISKIKQPSTDFEITEVFLSPFDSVFQVDPMPGNRTMFEGLSRLSVFHPLPVINPATGAWEDHLEELATNSQVVGLRLLPAYHGYRLNSKAVRRMVERVKAKGLRLVITARLVDERHEHRAVTIKPVSVSQIAAFIREHPKENPLIQGLSIHELKELSKADGLFYTDTSFAEWEDTLKILKGYIPVSRILYGSLSPLQVTLAQIDKVRLSSLTTRQRELVASDNARKYFGI